MRVVVTGGICDGKSAALGFVAALGLPTLDADVVVRELYQRVEVVAAIEREFGSDSVRQGLVNREWLRSAVLDDVGIRRRLNEIVHPLVMRRILDWCREQPGHCFVEIPLLIETATQGWFDRVWVAMAGREVQLARLSSRLDGDNRLAEQLLSAQLPTEAKAAFSDRILRTNGDLPSVSQMVTEFVQELG
jgi:dephospho-CoA kinase